MTRIVITAVLFVNAWLAPLAGAGEPRATRLDFVTTTEQVHAGRAHEKTSSWRVWATDRHARRSGDAGYMLIDRDAGRFWWVFPAARAYVALPLDFALEDVATAAQRRDLNRLRGLIAPLGRRAARAPDPLAPCDAPVGTAFSTASSRGSVHVCAMPRDAAWLPAARSMLDAPARLRTVRREWYGMVLEQPGLIQGFAYRNATDSTTTTVVSRLVDGPTEVVVPPDFFAIPEDYTERRLDVGKLFGLVTADRGPAAIRIEP